MKYNEPTEHELVGRENIRLQDCAREVDQIFRGVGGGLGHLQQKCTCSFAKGERKKYSIIG